MAPQLSQRNVVCQVGERTCLIWSLDGKSPAEASTMNQTFDASPPLPTLQPKHFHQTVKPKSLLVFHFSDPFCEDV